MKPVVVTAEVDRAREDVFERIDVLANHEAWTDHLFTDWRFEGPRRGVGAIARARINAPGSREQARIEVVEAERPERTVEEVESAHGKRRTRGTYRLVELAPERTRIELEIDWIEVPRSERILPPLSRAFMRRANGRAIRRLAALLEDEG